MLTLLLQVSCVVLYCCLIVFLVTSPTGINPNERNTSREKNKEIIVNLTLRFTNWIRLESWRKGIENTKIKNKSALAK